MTTFEPNLSSFERVLLQDICQLITDGKHGDCQDEDGSGYYFLSAKDVRGGKLIYEGARQITREDFEQTHKRTQLEPMDILMVSTGATIGRMAIATDIEETSRTTFQKSVAILKPDQRRVDPYWIYYYLHFAMRELINFTAGSAQKNLLLRDLRAFKINIPSIEFQKESASVLKLYDDLIANNERRIVLLEEAMHLLYREWFVHLRFPGWEKTAVVDGVPEGWEMGVLEDALKLQRGFDLPKRKRQNGDVPIYASTGIAGTHNQAKVKAPGVVTGRSGSLGTVMYVEDDFWPLNTALWVKEFRKATPIFAFLLLTYLHLENFNAGGAVPTLNRNHVHGLPVLIPPSNILKSFDSYVQPILDLRKTLREQNSKLREARDALLPRLMSGRIEV